MLHWIILHYMILYCSISCYITWRSTTSDVYTDDRQQSGSCRCTLIGVPCRLSMLSTVCTFAHVLFQYKSPRAEGAKTDPPPGYTYEGTQTTAWSKLPRGPQPRPGSSQGGFLLQRWWCISVYMWHVNCIIWYVIQSVYMYNIYVYICICVYIYIYIYVFTYYVYNKQQYVASSLVFHSFVISPLNHTSAIVCKLSRVSFFIGHQQQAPALTAATPREFPGGNLCFRCRLSNQTGTVSRMSRVGIRQIVNELNTPFFYSGNDERGSSKLTLFSFVKL